MLDSHVSKWLPTFCFSSFRKGFLWALEHPERGFFVGANARTREFGIWLKFNSRLSLEIARLSKSIYHVTGHYIEKHFFHVNLKVPVPGTQKYKIITFGSFRVKWEPTAFTNSKRDTLYIQCDRLLLAYVKNFFISAPIFKKFRIQTTKGWNQRYYITLL